MIKVITGNGEFHITQDLYESIMVNNPEILNEKSWKDKERKKAVENPKYKKSATDHMVSRLEDMRKNSDVVDPRQQIIDDQALKGNLPDEFKNDVSPEVKKEIKDAEVVSNTDNNSNNNDVQDNQEQDNVVADNIIDKDKEAEKLEHFINNADLKKQIASAKNLAGSIVKRIKKVIQSYVGIGGSAIPPIKGTTPTQQDTNAGSVTSVSNDTSPVENEVGNIENSVVDTTTEQPKQKASVLKNLSKVHPDVKLALGGFKLSPVITDFSRKNSDIGKVLKYYKSAQQKTSKSEIDDMISYLILLRTDPSRFEKTSDDVIKQFETMAYDYLRSTVYKLEINSTKNYENILRIIRFDQPLSDAFYINNVDTIQQFGTRENAIAYKNKSDDIIDMLVIAYPLFSQGSEIVNNLKPIWNNMKKLKR